MSEFPRWTDGEMPPRLRLLVDAAQADEPPEQVLRNSLAAVAAAGMVTLASQAAASSTIAAALGTGSAASSAKLSSSALTLVVVKWGFVGLAGGAAAIGALEGARQLGTADHTPVVAAAAAESSSVARESPPAMRPAAPIASARLDPGVTRPPRAVPSAVPSEQPSELAIEIGMIERARSALQEGRSGAALFEAEAYAARFPAGQFGQEMAFIRMEALARTGDLASARREAAELVRRYPSGPHLVRAQQVLDQEKE